MPDNSIVQLPRKLPLLVLGDASLFPCVEATIPFLLTPVLAEKIGEIRAVVLVADVSQNKKDIVLGKTGIVAAVTEPPSPTGETNVYEVKLSGLFRCLVKKVDTLADNRILQFQGEWEVMRPDEPVSQSEWGEDGLQNKITVLRGRLANAMALHSYIVPNFKESKFMALHAKNISFFMDPKPQELGEVLDRIALLVTFSTLMPARIPAGTSARKRIAGYLIKILEATKHSERLNIVLSLIDIFTQFLEHELMRKQRQDERGGEGGDEMEGKPSDELFKKYKEAEKDIPEHVKKVLKREMKKLSSMPPTSSEYTVTENYVDWLLRVPWGKFTQDTQDLVQVENILNEDHWGLQEIKGRIIEYLAAIKMNPKMKAPILGFVGPPGVGKTSLGKSIARSLGRKFERTSVGGIDDEAEIRGHRRTYIGALPGRIIDALSKTETMNPVIMIDEADKLGRGVRGDPGDALLEVLDPEQNHSFVDNYLAVGADLSKVFFIVTVNSLETMHPALRDRIEWIQFYSYTEDEKVHIAQRFLIPQEIKENGLSPEHFQERNQPPISITFSDEALRAIINEFAIEAGVREVKRIAAKILRKIVTRIAKNNSARQPDNERKAGQPEDQWEITEANLMNYLDKTDRRVDKNKLNLNLRAGVAPMLAVSNAGGQVFYIETMMRKKAGKRKIKVTGFDPHHQQIGTMLEESVDTAWDYLTCDRPEGPLVTSEEMPENMYLRVNFANGAVPKDGPSAGVPVLSALYSLAKKRPIKSGLVSTGEITLAMGEVLAVGGIKEKILGAARAGAREVIIPASVIHELDNVPQSIKDQVRIIPCSSMLESLKIAFPDDQELQSKTE